MKLSDKILKLRKQAGISQEELAAKLDVSRQAVSHWEVGSAIPDAVNVMQLSRLFGVTADYLLNDDYESDRDVPAVKNTEGANRERIKKIVALCVSAFGLLGNAFLYMLSRFIKVMVPFVYTAEEDGKIWYEWDGRTGYSYRYFIEEHDLEPVVAVLWALFLAGVIYIFLNGKRAQKLIAAMRGKRRQGA